MEPTVTTLRREPTDEFLLIACDGVWDVMSCVDAIGWVQRCLAREMSIKPKKSSSPKSSKKKSGDPTSGPMHVAQALERTCSQLLVECMALGSCDNMSVVLVIPAQVDDAGAYTPPDSEEPPSPTDTEVAALVAANTVDCAVKLGVAEASAALNPPRHLSRMERSMTILSSSMVNESTDDNDDTNEDASEWK